MTRIENIVVGFDGSAAAGTALQWAAGLAAAVGAELRIVHAVGLLEHAGLPGPIVSHDDAVRAVAGSGLAPDHVSWSMVDGDPCSALLRTTASEPSADLLVVGTRGAGAHLGSLLGSTSLELAEHASVPIVVVPATPT